MGRHATHTRLGPLETPRPHRNFARLLALLVLVWAWPVAARAQVLDEARVVALAQRAAPQVLRARARASLADARQVGAGLHPNPSVAWQRAHFPARGDAWQSEDSLVLNMPVDLSGERGAAANLARADAEGLRADAAARQASAVQQALLKFYQALRDAQRAAIAEQTLRGLDEATRVVAARLEQGTASGYDEARLSMEAELVRSRLVQARLAARASRTALATTLGLETPDAVELRGSLALGDAQVEVDDAGRERTSIRTARTAARQAAAATEDARTAWLPTLTLRAGLRLQNTDALRYGYVAGAALELPVFDRGQGIQAQAAARAQAAEAELTARVRDTRSLRQRSALELRALRAELARFDDATATQAERLLRAVRSGYREGERSLVELVDAERARARVALRRLELAFSAKRAELSLRAARGEFE